MTSAVANRSALPTRPTECAQADLHLSDTSAKREFAEIAGRVVDVTGDAVICLDAGNCVCFWNKGAEGMFGYPGDRAVGLPIEKLVASGMTLSLLRKFAESRSRGHALECDALRSDGSEFPVEISLATLPEGIAEGRLAVIVRDVSRRKRLERESLQSRALLDHVLSNLPATVFLKDAETREYIFINRAGEELLGLPASEIRGSSVAALFPHYALKTTLWRTG